MSDKMREEFEEWVDANEIFHDLFEEEYELMWAAWQASRQALVVELPSIDCMHSAEEYRDVVEMALTRAGIKWKE